VTKTFLAAIVMLQLLLPKREGKNHLQDTPTATRRWTRATNAPLPLVETKHTIGFSMLAVPMQRRRRVSIRSKSAVMLPTKRR
jgi:hypothetical protein